MTDLDIVKFAQEGQFDVLTKIFDTNHQIYEYIIRNALFWSVRNGHYKVVELLLLNGADIGFIYNKYQIISLTLSTVKTNMGMKKLFVTALPILIFNQFLKIAYLFLI